MTSTPSLAQYAARAEAAEAKIAELTNIAAQIQASLANGATGGGAGASAGGDGIGEFKEYFLERLKTVRVAIAEEHEQFLQLKTKNADLQKEVTKLKYRVEILTRELASKLGTPVPEGLFKQAEADTKEQLKDTEKGKEKEKDKGKEKGEKDKEKSKDKPSKEQGRKPSERKQSETGGSATQIEATPASGEGQKAQKGDKEQPKKEGKNQKGKEGEKAKKDSTSTESEAEATKTKKEEGGAKKGANKKGGEVDKKDAQKPKEEPAKTEAKAGGLDDKAVKACIKEGGKKGQDCAGMSTFGTHFFCVTIESAEGNMKLLEKAMEGMNTEVDPEAEDRKGGAGDLGKILFNANDQKLVIMCHTPQEVMDKATAAQWMEGVLTATGAKVTSQTENIIQAELDNDPDHGIYSLKLRDQGISASFEFLRSKGLMIDDDSEDENYAAAAGINLNAAPGSDY